MTANPPQSSFKGFEIPLRRLAGAKAARVIHPSQQTISAHDHDWACITLPVIGRGEEEYDGGCAELGGPSAVVHPPRAAHADSIAQGGLETVSIQFDPAWLKRRGFSLQLDRTRAWQGGSIGAVARQLASLWSDPNSPEDQLAQAVAHFIHTAVRSKSSLQPAWLDEAVRTVKSASGTINELSQRLDLHPAWLTRAYRTAVGEGVQDTVRRKRVEHAVSLVRGSALSLAEIAAESGFYDQSHMNRTFSAILGRTPAQVRAESSLLSVSDRNAADREF